jgi:hypothetical protein
VPVVLLSRSGCISERQDAIICLHRVIGRCKKRQLDHELLKGKNRGKIRRRINGGESLLNRLKKYVGLSLKKLLSFSGERVAVGRLPTLKARACSRVCSMRVRTWSMVLRSFQEVDRTSTTSPIFLGDPDFSVKWIEMCRRPHPEVKSIFLTHIKQSWQRPYL